MAKYISTEDNPPFFATGVTKTREQWMEALSLTTEEFDVLVGLGSMDLVEAGLIIFFDKISGKVTIKHDGRVLTEEECEIIIENIEGEWPDLDDLLVAS